MANSNENFKILREDIQLIENKLQRIISDIRKINGIYSNPGRLCILKYKSHKLIEDLLELRQDANEEYADVWLMQDELKNIKEETDILDAGVQDMINKYIINKN